MKTHIFVDFWNFQISINDATATGYRLDWNKVAPWFITQATNVVGRTLTYEGMHIYVSYDQRKDSKLRDFALNVLDRFPGIEVSLVERKAKSAPKCPQCHQLVTLCPHCGKPMAGTIEKGVDTAIVTDMLKMAWESSLEVAILVSSDRDFIPAVTLLNTKGYKVVNVHFPPDGMNLARVCWASIDLRTALPHIRR